MVIIIVLNPDLNVRIGPSFDYGSGWPLNQVNVGIKIIIIIVLKLNSRVDPRSGRVDQWMDQCKVKNYYYHSFKTWLEG